MLKPHLAKYVLEIKRGEGPAYIWEIVLNESMIYWLYNTCWLYATYLFLCNMYKKQQCNFFRFCNGNNSFQRKLIRSQNTPGQMCSVNLVNKTMVNKQNSASLKLFLFRIPPFPFIRSWSRAGELSSRSVNHTTPQWFLIWHIYAAQNNSWHYSYLIIFFEWL